MLHQGTLSVNEMNDILKNPTTRTKGEIMMTKGTTESASKLLAKLEAKLLNRESKERSAA